LLISNEAKAQIGYSIIYICSDAFAYK